MVRWSKIFLMLILAGLVLLAGAYVGAQEKAPAPAPRWRRKVLRRQRPGKGSGNR